MIRTGPSYFLALGWEFTLPCLPELPDLTHAIYLARYWCRESVNITCFDYKKTPSRSIAIFENQGRKRTRTDWLLPHINGGTCSAKVINSARNSHKVARFQSPAPTSSQFCLSNAAWESCTCDSKLMIASRGHRGASFHAL